MAKRYNFKNKSKNTIPVWVVALGILGAYFMLIEGKFVSIELD